MSYQFNWSVLWSGQSGGWLLQGVLTTLAISGLAWILAAALGILAGAARTVPWRPLRAAGTFYVEFFRNVPLLVWMFFWYFAVPPLLANAFRKTGDRCWTHRGHVLHRAALRRERIARWWLICTRRRYRDFLISRWITCSRRRCWWITSAR